MTSGLDTYPIEEFEAARFLSYVKKIQELQAEFMAYALKLNEKYLTPEQVKNNINRLSNDGKYIISVNYKQFMGQE